MKDEKRQAVLWPALKEPQIAAAMRKCQHFNGIQNDCCLAGVEYESLPRPLPCLGIVQESGEMPIESCTLYTPKTREQVLEDDRRCRESAQRLFDGLLAVQDHIDKTGKSSGVIECPSCDGRIRYTQATHNGHIAAICSNNCFAFMQ